MRFLLLFWHAIFLTVMLVPASAPAAAAPATPQEKLFAEIKVWAAGQLATTPDLVEVPPLDARLKIPHCTGKSTLSFPFSSKDTVRAHCTDPEWQAYIRIAITTPRNGVFAARALPGGKVLTDADLAVGRINIAAADIFDDRRHVIGKTLKRPLRPGDPILARDIDDLQVVLRITRPVKAGEPLSTANYRPESLARDMTPMGAALGEQSTQGARAKRDLQAGQILMAGDLAQLRKIVITRRDVEIGQVIEPGMVETVERSVSEPLDNLITDASTLAAYEFSRNIKAGEPLRRGDLKPALLVRRGQSVLVTLATDSGLELSFRAEALHDARMGEQISLKNQDSGKIIQGIVTGKGTARAL